MVKLACLAVVTGVWEAMWGFAQVGNISRVPRRRYGGGVWLGKVVLWSAGLCCCYLGFKKPLNKVLIVVTKIGACGSLVEMEVLHRIRGTASRVTWQVVFISFTVLVLGVGSSEVQIQFLGSDSKSSILHLG